MESTDWIKPGADILVYRDGGSGPTTLFRTTVALVRAKSFLVEDVRITPIKFETLASSRVPSGWGGFQYRAVHPDSDTAKALYASERRERILARAAAVVGYPTATDPVQLDLAIHTLTVWRDYLATEEEK
jgi:hypothetical protein